MRLPRGRRDSRSMSGDLLTDAERLDHGAIAVDVLGLEIVQEATALADQHEQAATRMVILRVHLEVLGEIRNPFRKQSDLHFGRPGITRFPRELLHDCRLKVRCEAHCSLSFLFEWSGMSQKKRGQSMSYLRVKSGRALLAAFIAGAAEP